MNLDCLGYFDPNEPIENAAGNLPHWRQEGVTYFVTFRLPIRSQPKRSHCGAASARIGIFAPRRRILRLSGASITSGLSSDFRNGWTPDTAPPY
jgi:hypothetical protein